MKVTTLQLSPDATVADPAFGQVERGEMPAAAVEDLLRRFTTVDASQNQHHDPQVIIRVREESHLIRTSRGRLLLYNARDVSQPGERIELPALMALLEGVPSSGATEEAVPAMPELEATPARRDIRGLIAVALLVAGVSMNLWSLAQWLMRPAPPVPACAPITDQPRLAQLRQQMPGTYVTGPDSGSRLITIKPDDSMEFALLAKDQLGAIHEIRRVHDSFVWSRHRDGTVCLATKAHSHVLLSSDAVLHLTGDNYFRQSSGGKR